MTTSADGVPALPYLGTAGYSGSETSEEQARREAEDGTVAARQRDALDRLRLRGQDGMTVAEYREAARLHHGKASSTLSTLHHDGLVARLLERRERCAVYVLPEHVHGRETAPHGRRDPVSEALHEWCVVRDDRGWNRAGRDPVGFARTMTALAGAT